MSTAYLLQQDLLSVAGKSARHSPLATDLTAREVNAQRTEAGRDFH